MSNFGASGRIIQNVSVCHLKTPTCFGDNGKKNPLVFPNRCEKSTCFFLPLEDQTSSEKTPYLYCRKQLLPAIMYFFATSRTED
jgi:hypothetical protein